MHGVMVGKIIKGQLLEFCDHYPITCKVTLPISKREIECCLAISSGESKGSLAR